MGRYYDTAYGDFNGKFWFGVQPSDDPEQVYGMRATCGDDSFTDYEAGEEDAENIMNALDEQFKKLGVSKEKRRYRFENSNEVGAYVWDELPDYYLTETVTKGRDGMPNIPWAMGERTMYPKTPEKVLAAARVNLGLNILNDIRKHGICQLNAEF